MLLKEYCISFQNMKIPLLTFEDHISEKRIFLRGLEYFQDDRIVDWEDNDQENRTFSVDGTDLYTVVVQLDPDDYIRSCSCDCPYDQGNLCKHEIACFFFLQKKLHQNKIQRQDKVRSFDEGTSSIRRKSQISSSHSKKALPEEDYEKIIRRGITNAYGKYGRVERDDTEDALAGAESLLPHFDSFLAKHDLIAATKLLTVMIKTLVQGIEKIDDSDGIYGDFISDLIEKIPEIFENISSIPPDEQVQIFSNLVELMKEENVRDYGLFGEEIFEQLVEVVSSTTAPLLLKEISRIKNAWYALNDDIGDAPTGDLEHYLLMEYKILKKI